MAGVPRLVYAGNFRPPWSTENHIAATFRELGWEVIWAQEDAIVQPNAWATFADRARRSDLVLYTRTWGLPHRPANVLWRELAHLGVPTASFHLDLFLGLDRAPLVTARDRDPLFTTSAVFTADGDHDDEWRALGVPHHWLRPGVLRSECRPGTPDPRWAAYDVAFVGSTRGYHAEWPYRRRLVAELERRFGSRFTPVPRRRQSAIRGLALNNLYATVPVIVGDSLCLRKGDAHYWSDRVYETLGRGGILVMPRIDALAAELDGCPSIFWYEWDNFANLTQRVRALVARFRDDPAERARLAREGSAFIAERCSYTRRVEEMLGVVGLPARVAEAHR